MTVTAHIPISPPSVPRAELPAAPARPAPRRDSGGKLYRADIEGLRGIAVLLVVAFHCGLAGFAGGFIGVDVFFVLSGYLITGLLVAEIDSSDRIDLLRFYARRARRLLPASALVLWVTLLVGVVILSPSELEVTGRAGRATALYLSNFFFSINAADYFAPDVGLNPLLHTWSLAVEEQFYLFWPLLIILGLRWRHSHRMLATLLVSMTVGSLLAGAWLTGHGGMRGFYWLPARGWEFGIGGIAALLPMGRLRLSPRAWHLLGWLGLLTVLVSAALINETTPFPGWIAVVPVLGTTLALVTGAEHLPGGTGRLLGLAPLQGLGRLSYSWYLWHWPFLVFAAVVIPDLSLTGRLLAAAAALGVAALSHHLLENPIRFHPVLTRRPGLSLGLALGITLFSAGLARVTMHVARRLSRSPAMRPIAAAIADIADMPRERCVSLGESADLKTCDFGDPTASTRVVLFGDSHATQWFNPLRDMAEARGWLLTTMVKSSCPATDIRSPGTSAAFTRSCDAWRKTAIARILALRPALVVLGSATTYLGRRARRNRADVSLADWRDGTRRTLATLSSAGLSLAVMRDSPSFPIDIPTCLERAIRHHWDPDGDCRMLREGSFNLAAFAAENTGAREIADVHFIDLSEQLCPVDVCPTTRDGMVMYRDDNHLTGKFAASLSPLLEQQLLPILALAH